MVKLMGLVLIIGSCSAVGIFMNRSLRERTVALQSFIVALQIIKAEIVFRALPLGDILQIIGQACRGPAADFFQAVQAEMGDGGQSFWDAARAWLSSLKVNGLSESDLRHISSALHAMGRYDGAAQSEAIAHAVRALEQELESANRELSQKGRLYRAMGATVGIMIALVIV